MQLCFDLCIILLKLQCNAILHQTVLQLDSQCKQTILLFLGHFSEETPSEMSFHIVSPMEIVKSPTLTESNVRLVDTPRV